MSLAPLEDVLTDWATAELIAEAEEPSCEWHALALVDCNSAASHRVGIRHVRTRPCPSVTPYVVCPEHVQQLRDYASHMVEAGVVRCGECRARINSVEDVLAYVLPLS